MLYNLNRIDFLTNHSNIPKSIIKSLVYTCGVSVTDEQIENKEKEIMNFVKNYKNEVNEDFEKIEDNDGLLKIATFVGDKKSWKSKDKLIDALKHIITFSSIVDIKNCLKNNRLKIGYKNNEDIYLCDPIMAYIYCLKERIQIDKNDSVRDIENKINDHLQNELELSKIAVVEERVKEEKKLEEEKDERVKSLEYRIENLQEEKDLKQEKVRDLEKINSDLFKDKNENYEILKTLKYQIENLKEEKSKSVRDLEYKIGKINEEKDERVKSLEYQIGKINEEKDERVKSLEYQIEKLKEEKSNVGDNERVKSLEYQIEKLKEENKKLPDKEIKLENLKKYLTKPALNFIVSKVLVDNEEAIYMGLKYLHFDLRKSPEPYKDLLGLNQTIMDRKVFLPDRNDTFSQNLKLNKNYYSLRHYYDKDLKDFYTPKILSELYEEYNIKDKKIETLENYFLRDNFYRGWLYDEYTYFEKKNFKLSSQKDILSFGKYNGKIISFEVDELIKHFKSKGNCNLFTEEKLDLQQIDFIKSLCSRFGQDQKYKELSSSLEGKRLEDNEYVKNFIEKYLYASYLVDKVLNDIMRIGFFIRGWRINDNMTYPLSKKDCVNYEEHKLIIKENVQRVLGEFKHHLGDIKDPSIRNIILNLPLVNYIAREFVYDKEDKKLENLIEMLEKYEEKEIREISNKSLLFSYYYSYTSSDKKHFPIENLELY